MTESEAMGFVQGKLDCMKKCNVFEREHIYNTDLCDNCEYCYSQGNFGNQKEAFSVAINALEKVQKFEAIGTIEEFKALKEKSVAKKPYIQQSERGDCFECPNCDSFIGYECDCRDEHYQIGYCPNCGQAIDWSDEE